ncbi:hypothetical protein DFH06DRAFT_214950 [Mycena polygramma]|nr:hypothetical protein DFH06DRAFT_214950 [Mycena polygramma]
MSTSSNETVSNLVVPLAAASAPTASQLDQKAAQPFCAGVTNAVATSPVPSFSGEKMPAWFRIPRPPARTKEEQDARFLRDMLYDVFDSPSQWYSELHAIGMIEKHARRLSCLEESRRDALLAKVLPSMSIMDRALLSDAIQHISPPAVSYIPRELSQTK